MRVTPHWASGKLLRYAGGTGDVDTEGVTHFGTSLYMSAERNNQNNGVSRNSVLQFDSAAAGTELVALRE